MNERNYETKSTEAFAKEYENRKGESLINFLINAINSTFISTRPEDCIFDVFKHLGIKVPMIFGKKDLLIQTVSILAISYCYLFYSLIREGVDKAFIRMEFMSYRRRCF